MTVVEDVLSVLADPTRRDILEHLSVHGQATATTLAGEMPISRQAVVQHLAVLDAIGLVQGKREGRERRFELRTEQLTATARWMDNLAAQWDRRLRMIRQIAEMDGDNPSGTRGPNKRDS